MPQKSHGESHYNTTSEYNSWLMMKGRCFNKNQRAYHRYGGRGITVCDRWLKYENFIADMGRKPTPEHSIDRINNDGNYEASNCRWATRKEQGKNRSTNRRATVDGICKTFTEWESQLGLTFGTIAWRIKLGWTEKQAVLTPIGEKRRSYC